MPAAPVKFAYWLPDVSGGLVANKRSEVGRWVLEGELPEPTWYF